MLGALTFGLIEPCHAIIGGARPADPASFNQGPRKITPLSLFALRRFRMRHVKTPGHLCLETHKPDKLGLLLAVPFAKECLFAYLLPFKQSGSISPCFIHEEVDQGRVLLKLSCYAKTTKWPSVTLASPMSTGQRLLTY